MLEQTLRPLYEAVRALDNPESLSILNIDEDLLESPSTTLEYVERCRAWTQLRNIANSIPDLLNQSDRIALVGFLGHFSSGKSSLINALLGISTNQNPGYRRDVGLHPTDTRITLITHRDHAQSAKGSAYTATDAVDVVHGPALPFLEHATLVDTPGLGNEEAEHEAVARFLHLCHVLVITIDGRRPFADKDKDFELLDTAFNKLEGVPKLLVVTSAEEFLTSRKASFEKGWQADEAAIFWNEAVERLRTDPRFRDHIDRFQNAPRFFVDSKEGFRVQQVKDALFPIVVDDAHRSRIRRAQGRYVLDTAADALRVLLEYISTRSANLNRLAGEAQRRAEGTAIAVEDLLQSLERSFATIRQRLQESRQGVPTSAFSVEATATAQTINESQGPALRAVEDGIRETLERQLREIRNATWNRARRHYMARTRAWFPTAGGLDAATLLDPHFNVKAGETEIRTAAMKCAQGILRVVNGQLAATAASSMQHLRRAPEAWDIGTRAHDVESALERFERLHDDSVTSFYAYVSAPSSRDLLREHGFVGFGESGEQAVRPEPIHARRCRGYAAISRTAETCKERLRDIRREEPEGIYPPLGEDEAWSVEESVFDDEYSAHVVSRVNTICRQRIEEFDSHLAQRVDHLVEEMNEERTRVASSRMQIWRARATLAVRFVLVASALAVLVLAFSWIAPTQFESLLLLVSGRLLEAILVGLFSTVLGQAILSIVSGAKNENVRQALRPVVLEKWALRTKRLGLARALKAYFEESYDQLVSDVGDMPLQVDQVIAGSVAVWIKSRSESFRKAEQALADLRQVIVARCGLFDEFIAVVNQHLDQIPHELREAAGKIKSHAIGEHMARIQSAARSVEAVKSEVGQIAQIAKRAL